VRSASARIIGGRERMNYTNGVVNLKVGREGVRTSSSALPANDATAGEEVTSEDGEHRRDLADANLVTADDSTCGQADYLRHLFLSEAELEPNTSQLLPGQPAESTRPLETPSIG
jgi:hypothetical protein